MRVISGDVKGKKLTAPQGLNTRPTTDRVKEAIFSAIQFDIEGRKVLDLFCGSAQMGIEALSRGAKECFFCDKDPSAIKIAVQNISSCGLQEKSTVQRWDSIAMLSKISVGEFGLIFLDPPYGVGLMEKAIEEICRFDILTQGGIIVCEHSKGQNIENLPLPYRVLKSYTYGTIGITTITRE